MIEGKLFLPLIKQCWENLRNPGIMLLGNATIFLEGLATFGQGLTPNQMQLRIPRNSLEIPKISLVYQVTFDEDQHIEINV